MCSVQSEKPVEIKYIETQCNCRNKKKKKKKKKKIIGIAMEKQIAGKLKNNSLYNCRAQLRICG